MKALPLPKLAVIFGSKDARWRLGLCFGDPFDEIDGDYSSALPRRFRRLFARSITFLLKRFGKAITLCESFTIDSLSNVSIPRGRAV